MKETVVVDREIYIYYLFDPRFPGQVRYIGQTKNNLNRRLIDHVCEATRKGKMSYKCNWIRKIISEGYKPEIKIIEISNNTLADDRESFWIDFYRENGILTNSSTGGKGPKLFGEARIKQLEYFQSLDRRTRLKASLANSKFDKSGFMKKRMSDPDNINNLRKIMTERNPFKGKTHSEEMRKLISERVKLGLTPEIKERLRLASIGRECSDETRKKMSNTRKGVSHDPTNYKLTPDKVVEIRDLISQGIGSSEIAKKYDVTWYAINNIKKGKSWKNV